MGGSRGDAGRSRNCEWKAFRELGLRSIGARLFPGVCRAPVKYHGTPCDDVLKWRIRVWPFKLKPIERGLLIRGRKYRREHTVVVDEVRVHRPAIRVRSYGRVTRRDLFQKRFRMICSGHLSLRYDPSSWVGMWFTLYRKAPAGFLPGSLPVSRRHQWPVISNHFRASNFRSWPATHRRGHHGRPSTRVDPNPPVVNACFAADPSTPMSVQNLIFALYHSARISL